MSSERPVLLPRRQGPAALEASTHLFTSATQHATSQCQVGDQEKTLAYEWDIFLSYPRAAHAGAWVHNHFLPVLRDCLTDTLPKPPRIFIDQSQPTGVDWPENIKTALLRSRLLLAVWTPTYFQSDWCLAEWLSMLERETFLAQQGVRPERGLVYQIVYSDGRHFHERAKRTQHRRELKKFTCPFDCFRDTPEYTQFYETLREIAEEIETHLDQIPDWQPNWPVVIPDNLEPQSANLDLARL